MLEQVVFTWPPGLAYNARMYLLFLMLISFSVSAAEMDPLDLKKGIVFGVGGIVSQFEFPVQFKGETRSSIDDESTLIGPTLQLGYDVVFRNRYLLGVRGETLLADTLGAGKKKTGTIDDQTTGNMYSTGLSMRGGYIFNMKGENIAAESYRLLGEFFFEAGVSLGHKGFIKDFSYHSASITEYYQDELSEDFKARVLAIGFNVTNGDGYFFELKAVQTTIFSNKQNFQGSSQINGGPLVPVRQSLKDKNMDTYMSLLLSFGHHF